MIPFGRLICGLALTLLSSVGAVSAEEVTPGGSTVHRYENHKYEFRAAEHQAEHVEEMTKYLEGFLGPSEEVWHELVSDKVHIDVLPFPPTKDRPYWTFVSSGMSDLPMNVPAQVEDRQAYQYAEVVISLPAEWFPGAKSIKDIDLGNEKHWPISLLKFIARFPHEYNTWMWGRHTMPNGDPAQPFADDIGLTGMILLPPVTWPEEKTEFKRSDGATVHFHAIYPLHDDEMRIKLDKGTDALIDLMADAGLTEILDQHRKSVAGAPGNLPESLRN